MTLPLGWARVAVRDLAAPGEQPVLTGPFGTSMGRDDFCAAGVPVLTIGCLTDEGVNLSKANFVAESKGSELSRYALRAGDLLFSRMASVGRAAIVPEYLSGALFNYHIMRLRLDERMFLPKLFVAYVRGAPEVRRYLEEVNHGATRDGINTTQLLAMPVNVPPIAEQRRIVTRLDALQARSRRAREALDEVPGLLEKLRQSILAAAFRGDLTKDWRAKNPDVEPADKLLQRIRAERRKKWEESELSRLLAKGKPPTDDRWKAKYEELDPTEATDLPALPATWCWASVEELTPFDAPAVYGIILPGEDIPDGIPYLRPVDIDKDGNIDFSSMKRTSPEVAASYARAALRPGDVVLSIVGTIGKAILVPPELDGANITQSSARIRPPSCVPPPYLRDALLSPLLRRQYDRFRFGNAVQRLNVEHVRKLAIPIAPEAEMSEIIRVADEGLARVQLKSISAIQDTLKALEKAILSKAFRGELVPQDPADEPAAAMLARLGAAAVPSTDSSPSPPPGKRRARHRKS